MSHIVIDTRPLQTPNSRERGIGYLTRGWLREYLKLPVSHHISLLIDPRLEPPDIPLNGSFWQPLPFISFDRLPVQPSLRDEIAARDRTERFLREQHADLFHMTSPFESEVVTGLLPLACRTVATFYDATQIIYQDECLRPGGPDYVAAYHAKLQSLRDCDRVAAISRWSAGDLLRFTSIPIERVDIVSPAVVDDIGTASDADKAWPRRIGQPYMLAVLSPNPVKNVERLLAAYSALPAVLKAQYKLVVVYRIPNTYHRNELSAWIRKYSTGDRVLFTDYVARAALDTLYRSATVLVHPSLYEGFGMPILEAMAAGKPVIVSNTSSMPEVAGDAGMLVNPLDAESITDAMTRMLSNPDLRAEMGGRALKQAQRYSWRQSALAVRDIYEQVLAAPSASGAPAVPPTAPSGELADITDRRYRASSTVPLLGPAISAARDALTSHLRAPYFDVMVERQAHINLEITRRLQAIAWQMGEDDLPARTPIAESIPIAYSECLGGDFFNDLYNLYGLGLSRSDPLHRDALLRITARIRRLSRMLLYFRQQADLVADDALRMERCDVMERGYRVQSHFPLMGPLIVMARHRLTDRLRREAIDTVFERQVGFNRLVLAWLQKPHDVPASALALDMLASRADIVKPGRSIQKDVPRLIEWLRAHSSWHLLKPYIQPVFDRQVRFNNATVDSVMTIENRLASNRAARMRPAAERLASLRELLAARLGEVDKLADQTVYGLSAVRLLQRIVACMPDSTHSSENG